MTVSRIGDGLVAIKQADDPDRIRHEARVLSRLHHPGIVEFVDLDDRDPPALVMRHAGTETWELDAPTDRAGIVTGLASVAATVRDLHDLGIVHGDLRPDHVIIGRDGRPILCGFASATEYTADAALADTRGLAALLDHFAVLAEPALGEPLRTLSRRLAGDELDAAALTERLNELGRDRTRRRPGMPIAGPWPLRRTAAMLGIAAAVAAVLSLRGDQPAIDVDVAAARAASPASTIAPAAPPTSTTMAVPPQRPTTTTAAPAAFPDPPVATAIEFVHDGRRYGVGEPGDIAVLGDWSCDEVATPAVLHVATGQVAVFADWPVPGATIAPATVIVISDATDLRVEPADDCDRLRVIHPTGSTLVPMSRS